MWQKWLRDLRVQFHWIKIDIIRRWRLDTSAGTMGIITLILGVVLLAVIGDGIAKIFQSFIPWVAGSRVGEVYWQSIGLGIKTSFSFLLFSVSLIIFLYIKFSERP